MANVRNANTYYIDTASGGTVTAPTTDYLQIPNVRVTHVYYKSSAATNNIVLKDITTGATKLNLSVEAANQSLFLDFSDNPIVFPNGIFVSTKTDATATLVGRETQG